MSSESETPTVTAPGTGRPVVLTPMPPGWWGVIGGGIIAALGPLFGFLIGSMIGPGSVDDDGLSPLYLWLFIGFVVGGLGIGLALLGARTIYRGRMAAEADQ